MHIKHVKILASRIYLKASVIGDSYTKCWIYKGTLCRDGYGKISYFRKEYRSHRISYEFYNDKKIPSGMVIDHVCKVRACCNPLHLRIVTPTQNSMENSNGLGCINSKKKKCKHGHPFNKKNTLIIRNKHGKGKHARSCKTCRKQYLYNYFLKIKSKKEKNHVTSNSK